MSLDWPADDAHRPGAEYVRYAQVYDALFGDLVDDARLYDRLAREHARSGAVLELGSGTGRLTERLLREGHDVVGVDASPEMLSIAASKLAAFDRRYEGHQADVRTMRLGRSFPLVVAPYGMVAHLLTDDDRRAAFRTIHDHLVPGGVFAFDDMPGWLAGPSDSTKLELRRTGFDAAAKMPVRLLANTIEAAGEPYTIRYDIIDWLDGDAVAKRVVVRVLFRNIALDDELRLLREAGFAGVEVYGDFDGRAFDRADVGANRRLVLVCRKSS